jgi:hypothetical protein
VLTSPDGHRLDLERALPADPARPPAPAVEETRILTEQEMRALEGENLRRAVERCGGKISGPGGAAELLGLPPNTLTSRLKALGPAPHRRP